MKTLRLTAALAGLALAAAGCGSSSSSTPQAGNSSSSTSSAGGSSSSTTTGSSSSTTTGSSSSTTSTTGSSSSSTASAQTVNPSGAPSISASLPSLTGQTITVDAEWQGTEEANFKKVIAAFEKATGATVQYTSTGNNTATVLGTAVQGGNPPNVALIPQPGLIQQFVKSHNVTPLPDSVANVVKQNYSSVWQQLGTFNNKLYAVWFKAANKSTMWYRTAVFQNAGVQPPKTWKDFLNVLKQIRASGTTPLSIGGGDGWTLTDWFENVYLQTAGPQKYDELTQHKIPWTDQSVTNALQILSNLWSQSNLIVANPTSTSFTDSVTQVFGQKKGAVVYEGDFVAGVITGSTNAKIGTDANFFPFPNINNAPDSVVGGGDAAVLMKDSPAAEAFMTYLAMPQSADIWVKAGGFTSPNHNVPNADYPDQVSQKIAQQLVSAKVFRFDMSDQEPAQFGGTPGQGEWQDLQNFLAHPDQIQQTEQKLESDAKAAYGS